MSPVGFDLESFWWCFKYCILGNFNSTTASHKHVICISNDFWTRLLLIMMSVLYLEVTSYMPNETWSRVFWLMSVLFIEVQLYDCISYAPNWIWTQNFWVVGWLYWGFTSLSAVFQPYSNLEVGDNQSRKKKWRGRESNPRTLAPQAKSLTTRPSPLPQNLWEAKTIIYRKAQRHQCITHVFH